jgi:hypothetical protein
MTTDTPAKLPVWKTVADIYIVTARHALELLRFAWPWLAVLIIASGALYWGLYSAEQEALQSHIMSSASLWYTTLFVSTAIGAAIAVPWHRTILLNETQTAAANLKADATRLTYFAYALMLGVAPFALLYAVDWSKPQSATVVFASTVALLLTWPIFNRLSLILPAIAVGHNNVTIQNVWQATHGQTIRLLATSLLQIVPFFAVIVAVVFLAPDTDPAANQVQSRFAFTASNVLWEIAAIFIGMLFVTFLSLAYRHFFGLPEDATAPH